MTILIRAESQTDQESVFMINEQAFGRPAEAQLAQNLGAFDVDPIP